MIKYIARWVVPIAGPPIEDGWIVVDDGRVVAVGGRGQSSPASDARDLGEVAILPGLVNAHTHLELSYLRGAIPQGRQFMDWIRGLLRARRPTQDAAAPEILAALDRGIDEAVATGSVLVGDISNSLASVGPLTKSQLAAVVFYELVRFREDDPDGFVEQACRAIDEQAVSDAVRIRIAPHAPYSVGPRVLRALRTAMTARGLAPTSVHLAESAEEVQFVARGDGPWRTLLEELGVWDPAWVPPGTSPVEYLAGLGFIDRNAIVVHGAQMSPGDLDRLRRIGSTLVACPRSNQYTGAGIPPIERFYQSRVRVAVGTDSLASAPDLNVFAELAEMRRLAPAVPAAALLDSATRQGAAALGFDADFGTIEPGKRARLLAVQVPPRTTDVEEYLVSGIERGALAWVGETASS